MNLCMDDCRKFDAILNGELLTALGCTEPIAIAYGAAKARELLGALPNDAKAELVRGYLAANQMLDYLFEQTKGE